MTKMVMKVKEIIQVLQKCDQDLPVYAYFNDDIHEVLKVDDSMDDRIDLNIEEETQMSKIKELEKEITENLFQLSKHELIIIIRLIQSMINKQYMGEDIDGKV
jgi:hypothetical protein